MSILGFILLFTFLGSLGALIGGFLLISNKKLALKLSHFIAAFAAGTILGAAFFDLLPEALHGGEKFNINIPFWVLVGIVVFFLIERTIHFFHHHEKQHEHDREIKSTIPLIVIGDTMHNFVDGIVISASFLVSIPLGIVSSLAVAFHEIPQEIGDFGLLLHKGLSPKKVIQVNILSASVAIVGAIITYLLGDIFEQIIPLLIAVTVGFFIYISTSDLLPEIQYEKNRKFAIIKTILFIIGLLLIYFSVNLIGHGN